MTRLAPKPSLRSVFVLGTDTGVGKTIVSAALLELLKSRGCEPGAMKPVETGFTERAAENSDARLLAQASGRCRADLDLVGPYVFSEPVSPHLAAEMQGAQIDVEVIVSAYRRLAGSFSPIVVEGAGGVLTPIKRDLLMADLAAALELDTVLVCRPALGGISLALSAIECLRSRGLRVRAAVFNGYDAHGSIAMRTIPEEVEKISGVPAATFPLFSEGSNDELFRSPRQLLTRLRDVILEQDRIQGIFERIFVDDGPLRAGPFDRISGSSGVNRVK